MGWTYIGTYADLIDAGAHEGYAAAVLPDGTETGVLTAKARESTGYRACCECGWRGTGIYPPTEYGEESAEIAWDHDHLWPMIRDKVSKYTIPVRPLVSFARGLREAGSSAHARGMAIAAESLDDLLYTLIRFDSDPQSGGGR